MLLIYLGIIRPTSVSQSSGAETSLGINTALLRSSSAPACSVFRLNGQVLPVTQERLAAILPALLHSADYGLPFSHSKFEPTLLAQELSLSDQNGGLSANGN